jgi:ribonuclease HII
LVFITSFACRGIIDAAGIDDINILEATLRAMEAAVQQLPGKPPAAVLIDGNQIPPGVKADHVQSIVKGDAVCHSIAAASILAKVTRDRMMLQAHAKWPAYGFANHKGYGTKAHMAAVQTHGPCPIHRLTFRPLPEIVERLKAQGQKVDTALAGKLEAG